MSEVHSDALVFFGATGDQTRASKRARHRGRQSELGPKCANGSRPRQPGKARRTRSDGFRKALRSAALCRRRLRRSGDFAAFRKEPAGARRPAHYLAIRPTWFGKVIEQLAASGCAKGSCICIPRNVLEPRVFRKRADHDGRKLRRARPGRVLRSDWHDPLCRSKPPLPGARQYSDC